MSKENKYLVYRIFSKKERPELDPKERSVFYGWTTHKNVIKAFLSQRNRKKYKVLKMSDEEIEKIFSEDLCYEESKIDITKLVSSETHETSIFFTTADELRGAEIKIQQLFHELSSIKDIPGNNNYLDMILHLDSYYFNALCIIGYRPPELDDLFDSADDRDNYSNMHDVEESINYGYDELFSYHENYRKDVKMPLGISILNDISSKIIYSLESFIMVLKDDL